MRTLAAVGCMVVVLSLGSSAFAKAPKADNTAQNNGAMSNNAVTADKQGNSKD